MCCLHAPCGLLPRLQPAWTPNPCLLPCCLAILVEFYLPGQYHNNVDRFKWPQNLSDPSVASLGRSLLSQLPDGLDPNLAKAVGEQVEARLRRGLKPHGISARILKAEVVPAGSAPGLKCAGERVCGWAGQAAPAPGQVCELEAGVATKQGWDPRAAQSS